ncbi:MAG: hypothetical protein AB9866_04540 [Syntrophobacteraceae bacterium]
MIECIFTIDYEIYGNGEGSLEELIYEPAKRLAAIFKKWEARFLTFVEVAELEMIESKGTDHAIDLVREQMREFHREGFELGLHLHPQWYNARFENGKWLLDYSEYNLCRLPRERIVQIVDRSIAYFRKILGVDSFVPFSFRAGNWLFQPTGTAARVLIDRGIKVDSSVFKGGLQHQHHLDYRRAPKNSYYWTFSDHVDVPDSGGAMLELPIYTEMVRPWKFITAKRVGLQRKGSSQLNVRMERMHRILDFLRPWQPLKFDFCRLTSDQLISMVHRVLQEDQRDPKSFRPIVAIGHTKDLLDFEPVEALLSHLSKHSIKVTTFTDVYNKCKSSA